MQNKSRGFSHSTIPYV